LRAAENIGAAAGELVQRANSAEARLAVGAGALLADAFAERVFGMIGTTCAVGIDGDAGKRGKKLSRRFCALRVIDQHGKLPYRAAVARQVHPRRLQATEVVDRAGPAMEGNRCRDGLAGDLSHHGLKFVPRWQILGVPGVQRDQAQQKREVHTSQTHCGSRRSHRYRIVDVKITLEMRHLAGSRRLC
jgi:hypothetical protein